MARVFREAVVRPVPGRAEQRSPLSSEVSALKRHVLHAAAYAFAALIGLGLIPAAFTLADRVAVLRWSKEILDLISRP